MKLLVDDTIDAREERLITRSFLNHQWYVAKKASLSAKAARRASRVVTSDTFAADQNALHWEGS